MNSASLTKYALGLGVTAALALSGGAARAADGPLSVAIVVGSNQSPSSNLENLRYGDDDAVQNARTFTLLGAQTTLLVSPDAETRELNPTIHPQAPATRAALRKAFDDAKSTLAAARAAGRKTELYFLFAGHGDMADNRAFLQVDDGRLYREDLAELLRTAGADENHVLVDACYAASFVSDRGPGGTRESLPAGFSQTQVAWPKNTGFLTARSAGGGQTHEWAEYQSGVFSHELRSGLMGAADANVDGKITYREIAAFVHRANEAIPNRRYRPEVSTIPPEGNLDAELAALPPGPLVLEMDTPSDGRAYVETETGVRLVDLHPAPGAPVKLLLPTDMGNMFVEQLTGPGTAPTREYRLPAQAGHVMLSSLTAEQTPVRARGAGHEAFMHLFARPFDLVAVNTFTLETEDAAELQWEREQDAENAKNAKTLRRRLALGSWALSIGSGVAAYEFHKAALDIYNQHPYDTAYNPQIDRRNFAMGAFIGLSAASAVTGAILWFWPSAPNVSVASTSDCEACFTYSRSF